MGAPLLRLAWAGFKPVSRTPVNPEVETVSFAAHCPGRVSPAVAGVRKLRGRAELKGRGFDSRYTWANAEFTPRQTMRGKMLLDDPS
jgi:hypothetical protein